MLLHHERGSVLAADLVLAAAIVVTVASTTAAFGGAAARIQDHREAARSAAVVAARTGDAAAALTTAQRLSPGAVIRITASPNSIAVSASSSLVVAHPVSGRITLTARGEAVVPVAPYRSNRG